MRAQTLTNILDLLAGISAAPEIIGRVRLEAVRGRVAKILETQRLKAPLVPFRNFGKSFFTGGAPALPTERSDNRFWAILYIAGALVGIVWTTFAIRNRDDGETVAVGLIGRQWPDWLEVLGLTVAAPIEFTVITLLAALFLLMTLSTFIYILVLPAGWILEGILTLLHKVASRIELSRALLLLGFTLFCVSGVIKIGFT